MARIRTIKPEFWTHEDLSALPEATHILAAALLNYADDFGYFNANPELVLAACSPLREPSVSIPESLRRLQAVGYIELGSGAKGRRYGRIVNFREHQRVSHPTASKIESLSIAWDDSGNIPEVSQNPPETFRPEQGTGNREQGTGKGTGTGTGNSADKPAPASSAKAKLDYSGWPTQPSPQVLADWQAMRNKLKAPVSQTVINQFGKELAAAAAGGASVDDCLAECVTRGWRGFKAEWLRRGSGPPAGGQDRHASFDNRDYTRGVNPDGTF